MTESELSLIAFDNAPIGLVLTERRVIRSCNETFAKMLGYDRTSLIGQSFRMFYASEDEFETIRNIGMPSLIETGLYSDERMMLHKDGSNLWCRFRAQSIVPHDPLARIVLSFSLISQSHNMVSLTPRERQVLGHMRQGKTSKEIARLLDRSPRTIEDVRARLLKRFAVKNGAELLTKLTNLDG